jgi:hypothetical protein
MEYNDKENELLVFLMLQAQSLETLIIETEWIL